MAATATPKVSARELIRQAKALGIDSAESLSRADLAKAVAAASSSGGSAASGEPKARKPKRAPREKVVAEEATETPAPRRKAKRAAKPVRTRKATATTSPAKKAPARKTAAKKTAAVKKAPAAKRAAPTKSHHDGQEHVNGWYISKPSGSTPKALPEDGVIPFRRNSNLWRVAKLLLQGGKRVNLAEKLKSQVDLHPYQKAEVDLQDYDKRLLLGAQTMRDQFGYEIARKGRGINGEVRVFIPGTSKDPRGASTNGSRARGTIKKAAKSRKG